MGPLRARARGEKSVLKFGAFFQVFRSQFRSLADRWCFSAIGHVGSAFREGSAGAYLILCSHTMLWTENAPGKERLTICPASSKNGPRDLRSNRCAPRGRRSALSFRPPAVVRRAKSRKVETPRQSIPVVSPFWTVSELPTLPDFRCTDPSCLAAAWRGRWRRRDRRRRAAEAPQRRGCCGSAPSSAARRLRGGRWPAARRRR